MTLITYKFQGAEFKARQMTGETQLQAVTRSIERKPGVGGVCSRLSSLEQDSRGATIARLYQIAVTGRELSYKRGGGRPVICEFFFNERMANV